MVCITNMLYVTVHIPTPFGGGAAIPCRIAPAR